MQTKSTFVLLTFFFFENYVFVFWVFKIYLFYFQLCWVFAAVCRLFSGCGEWGLLFVAVRGLLIAVASLVVEHGL